VSLFGVGSAFWGLAAGIAALAAQNLKLRRP
jgi:predicted benzoate:H+ symporter BenE